MKAEQITEENICVLINAFYQKVRKDKDLGPIFLVAIGEDDESWKYHLKILYDFWSSIMLGSGRYRGNPLQKHRLLPPFDISMFDIWLSLFAKAAHEIYTPGIAEQFINRSKRISNSLKLGMYNDLTLK